MTYGVTLTHAALLATAAKQQSYTVATTCALYVVLQLTNRVVICCCVLLQGRKHAELDRDDVKTLLQHQLQVRLQCSVHACMCMEHMHTAAREFVCGTQPNNMHMCTGR